MPMMLEQSEAYGRMIAAGRMLAGLDQAELGKLAGVAGATISNVERGNDARDDTRKAVRKALRDLGICLTWDSKNGIMAVTVAFDQPDEDD